jgi:hypothetical protein
MSKYGPYGDGPAEYVFGDKVYVENPAARFRYDNPKGHKYAVRVVGLRDDTDRVFFRVMATGQYGALEVTRDGKVTPLHWQIMWNIPNKSGYDSVISSMPPRIIQDYRAARGVIDMEMGRNNHLRRVLEHDPTWGIRDPEVDVSHGEPTTTFDDDSNSNKTGVSTMNTKEMIAVMQINGGAKIVSARYLEGTTQRDYHFKNVVGLALKEGDIVVAETRDTLQLVKVVDPNVRANAICCGMHELKHIVSKVNTDALDKIKDAEADAEHASAMSEITERMEKFREQVGNAAFNNVAGILAAPNKTFNDTITVDPDDLIDEKVNADIRYTDGSGKVGHDFMPYTTNG